ncbi:Zn-binding domain-containing protein [Streptomyces sp. NPDC019224]|uniref:Zn-binding domain-containing protein n=1 Tax=Streptomyces sp. NPDC019224 TaxID=3154484 RepID=UPI0033F5DD00
MPQDFLAGDEQNPRAGILVHTAVPDSEGALGGLVSLAEERGLDRIVRRALADASRCSADPLCSERLPHAPADFLHGAACHLCLFVSETTCERGNRFLDRRFLVPLTGDKDLVLTPATTARGVRVHVVVETLAGARGLLSGREPARAFASIPGLCL